MSRLTLSRCDLPWLLALGLVAAVLGLRFVDWPLNRDITAYGTIAAELDHGARLYADVWDLKPPGIFVAFLAARRAISDQTTQIFLLKLFPMLVVLGAVFAASRAAGFGRSAALTAGAFWVLLSVNLDLQLQEPNTEAFINACSAVAFVLLLRLGPRRGAGGALVVGLLFAIACLFKTVAIAIAAAVGLAYLVLPRAGEPTAQRARNLLYMTLAGAATLAAVVAYFVATARGHEFREAMIDAGSAYAGDLWANVRQALTFQPIVGRRSPLLGAAVATAPWLALAGIAGWWDRPRARSWLLLGAWGFGALVAVGLPGHFYRHYFQFLVPPVCLAIGWLAATPLTLRTPALRRLPLVAAALAGLGLALLESRPFRSTVDQTLAGTYQVMYLQTQRMARRLALALRPEETLYQWGEESGLYWYSGRRPPASVLTFVLLGGPQAVRLTRQSLASLAARPPDLVVAANYTLGNGRGHPVFEWVQERYEPVRPRLESERRYFTFFVPRGSGPEFLARIGAERP